MLGAFMTLEDFGDHEMLALSRWAGERIIMQINYKIVLCDLFPA